MPRSHRQEALSRAYVRAVAAQAGLTVSDVGPQLDLQLKSTTGAIVGTTSLTYDLPVLNYDDLREHDEKSARILIVLVMPEDEANWLAQSPEELALRHCAWWLSLKGSPPTTATTTVRVSIPLTNVFSVAAVQAIVERLRERKDP